jgi:uncharacterized phage-associated protein
MSISASKLKAIILYFSINTNKLGKIKLMKLFYYLDFVHLKRYGRPVTFDTYIHLEHGPIPSVIKNIIDEASDDIEYSVLRDTIKVEKVKTRKNEMSKFRPLRDFTKDDEKLFSETELEVLAEIARRFQDSTSDQIEKESHNESSYKKTRYLQTIPYELAAEDKDTDVTKNEIELLLNEI